MAFERCKSENPHPVILQLYILRQLAVTLAIFLGGITFVIFPAVAVSAITRLGGVNISAILRYLPLAAMDLLPYLLPMGFLLAITAAYGRLAADNEWTAIQMARRNPYKLLAPAFLLALLFSFGNYHLLATVRPEWKFEQRAFARTTLIESFKELNPGRTELAFGDFYLNAARRPAPQTFAEVLVHIPGDTNAEDLKIVADRATFRFTDIELIVAFENARIIKGSDDLTTERPEVRIPLDELFKDKERAREAGKYFTSKQLHERLDDPAILASLSESRIAQYHYELQRRPALAFSFLLFVLFGAPIGLTLRKGTRLGAMSASVGVAFVYYIGSLRLGKQLAEVAGVQPDLAVWSTNAVGVFVGLILTWRSLKR